LLPFFCFFFIWFLLFKLPGHLVALAAVARLIWRMQGKSVAVSPPASSQDEQSSFLLKFQSPPPYVSPSLSFTRFTSPLFTDASPPIAGSTTPPSRPLSFFFKKKQKKDQTPVLLVLATLLFQPPLI
jgi:hypothetical protein